MILVTEATGAVGSELLRLLFQAGVSTRALDRHREVVTDSSVVISPGLPEQAIRIAD